MSADDNLRAFVRALPKTETHLHVEGALPYELLHAWQPRKYPATAYFRAPDYRFPDFSTFDETLLSHALPWFTSAERYHESARLMFAKHVVENVRYVETSFHLPVTEFIHVPGREIIAAIRSAAPPGVEVRVFAGMLRTDYHGTLQSVIDDLVNWDELDGVDLHGFERVPTQSWTAGVWSKLREAGKITKCHAGEFDGAERVREAIETLGVTRVEHGVRAVEDPSVLALARDRGVTFDVCPISNLKLGVVPSLAEHPLRTLMKAGIRCTVSTDDPLVFGNCVGDEYCALARDAAFSRSELATLVSSGWEAAAIDSSSRTRWIEEVARISRELPDDAF